MHGLILAGGEGRRLAAHGVTIPKAMVPVGGLPQLVRLVRNFAALGCDSITCLLREGVPAELVEHEAGRLTMPCAVHRCSTPSSLHTLVKGLQIVPPGQVLCSMVDTVMPWDDWRRTAREITCALAAGADAVLVVTPYVDDERPLHVQRDGAGFVMAVGDTPADPLCVTGGIYGLSSRARETASEAIGAGVQRMRDYLGLLVRRGAAIATVEVPRIIDLDDLRDLEAANTWPEYCGGTQDPMSDP